MASISFSLGTGWEDRSSCMAFGKSSFPLYSSHDQCAMAWISCVWNLFFVCTMRLFDHTIDWKTTKTGHWNLDAQMKVWWTNSLVNALQPQTCHLLDRKGFVVSCSACMEGMFCVICTGDFLRAMKMMIWFKWKKMKSDSSEIGRDWNLHARVLSFLFSKYHMFGHPLRIFFVWVWVMMIGDHTFCRYRTDRVWSCEYMGNEMSSGWIREERASYGLPIGSPFPFPFCVFLIETVAVGVPDSLRCMDVWMYGRVSSVHWCVRVSVESPNGS